MKPDWYDDPDDPKAERWWDGQSWGPNRRRKQSAQQTNRNQPVPPDAKTNFDPRSRPSEPPIFSYPAFAEGLSASGFEEVRHDAGPRARQTSENSRSTFGVHEALALLFAFSGLAFVASTFAVWGRVREAGYFDGTDATFSADFPGMGDPSRRGRLSNGNGTIELVPDSALHNTNPGWIALAAGVVLLAIALAYYLSWNRRFVGMTAAALGAAAMVVCISYLIDLRGAFDDPIEVASFDFSPGLGLIAATALSVLVVILGAVAFILDQRSQPTSS